MNVKNMNNVQLEKHLVYVFILLSHFMYENKKNRKINNIYLPTMNKISRTLE